ncbi:MAG: MFS transporter [Gammaproteobacteria bacterium]|nr:MFS transporter [Gammaproteobacteria bacterium]
MLQIPAGYLSDRFGGKWVLGLGVIFWSLFTLLTPISAMLGLSILFLCRFLMGMAESVTWPSIYALYSQWIHPDRRASAVGLMNSGIAGGSVIALICTPWLITVWSWQGAFYLYGALGVAWFIVWIVSAQSRPSPLPRRLVLYRTSNWAVLPAEHQEQIEKLAQRLATGFAEYREQDALPDLEALTGHQRTVHAGELASELGWLVTQHGELLSDTFKGFVTEGRGYAGSVLDAAIRAIQIARDRANEYVRPDEVWLTPSVTSVAPPIETGTGDPLFCRQWTALGVPCLTLPLLSESATDLPYGPQLIASQGADRRILEAGRAIMKLVGDGGDR